jgi:threonine/homoserine/homoserine lactone efflux protein
MMPLPDHPMSVVNALIVLAVMAVITISVTFCTLFRGVIRLSYDPKSARRYLGTSVGLVLLLAAGWIALFSPHARPPRPS